MDEDYKIVIDYKTLRKNYNEKHEFLFNSTVEYYLVSNYPKKEYYSIFLFCFLNNIMPNKIILSSKLFKYDFSQVHIFLTELKQNSKHILFVSDYEEDINKIMDIRNISYSNYSNFLVYLEKVRKAKIKTFN